MKSDPFCPVLSVLIVTHNQRELLKRCLESVLKQDLQVLFEIIVSDDRSNDGTMNLVLEQKELWEKQKKNLVEIRYLQCNSNDCHPSTMSERCGWNKLNAYLHARGKYFVNVDADDYLLGSDVYQRQIDLLEMHPECSMCMQRSVSLHEGESIASGLIEPIHPQLIDEAIISKEDFVLSNLRGVNPTYMIRRYPEDDIQALYGKWFDDTVITYHHLQHGSVVFLDRADYVWMQYPKSISHEMSSDDMLIAYGLLPLHHAQMIPALQKLFLRQGLKTIIHMIKVAPEFPKLSQQYQEYFSKQEGFIYTYYTSESHGVLEKIRYIGIRGLLLMMNKYNLNSSNWLKLAKRALL